METIGFPRHLSYVVILRKTRPLATDDFSLVIPERDTLVQYQALIKTTRGCKISGI